jgi:hypothetical protein
MLGALALALMVSVVTPNLAWANVTRVFLLVGQFDNGTLLDGEVTIDITAGVFTAIDATAGTFDFTSVDGQVPPNGMFSYAAANSAHLFVQIDVASLVGYDGGAIAKGTRLDDLRTHPVTVTYLTRGVPVDPRPIPELSTWAMMLLGFAGLGSYAAFRTSNKNIAATV